jgi:hypothetical protein
MPTDKDNEAAQQDVSQSVALEEKDVELALDEMDVDAVTEGHHPFTDNGI